MTNDELLQVIQQAARNGVTKLDLSRKDLFFLPLEIAQLTNLLELDLSRNQLTQLPEEIGQLLNLQSLNLSYNRLISLPITIGKLTNLVELDLWFNRLSNLPDEVSQLIHLKRLELAYNQLESLPNGVGQLTKLSRLTLAANNLEGLPIGIGNLSNLRIELAGNPLSSLPPEITGKNGREIINFYRQQIEQKADQVYEAKLLIVGEPYAGKTTLAKKIPDPTYKLQDELSTEGIEVICWHFPLKNGKEFRVNIWDFGGQEIYHATHQFFLTKRSLYALVADSRKEDTDFYYWLNVVELLSENSPLLIIKNEREERKREINERQLRGEFTNLKETLATNFATNRGLSEILAAIEHYIQTLPHVGTELPKTWIKVREALEQDERNYIALDEYLRICKDNGFTRREDALQLSNYLHDLGVCLHFQKDDLLMRTVILKPTWGTDAVYRVLDNDRVVQNLGKFDRNDLAEIWHEDKYADMRLELLRLMMNFKLCYEIASIPGTYIAPQLLSPNQVKYDWDESENLLLRYEYEFMPKGILTRFIVEIHPWIEQQNYVWKTGVILNKDDAKAEVTELYHYHKGEIRIRVAGKRKRDMLTTIRHELDKIHKSYNRLRYRTLVPCNCVTCKDSQFPHFYSLERLHKFKDDRKDIQCPNSYEMVNVRSLVDDSTQEQSRSTDRQKHRLQQQIHSLQEEWEKRNEKLRRLRQDLAIATDTNRKFELEQQIHTEEADLKQLEVRINEIEEKLSE